MSSTKLTIALFAAFISGMLTHSTIYPRYQASASEQDASALRKPLYLSSRAKIGRASWYSKESPGIRETTANNEIFNDQTLTAAMWGVPFNSIVRVTNLDNGKSVIVRINDRGPHKRYYEQGRVIDLTKKAFRQIGALQKGLINVHVEIL